MLKSKRGLRFVARILPRKMRPLLLSTIAFLTLLEIIAFSPASVEEKESKSAVDPETLVPEKDRTLATGIPKNKVPDYSVEKFSYISTHGNEKEWKLDSDQAYLFNHEKLVHATRVKAFLYDPDDKITVVTGKEAKYIMGEKNLEIFGDVRTIFPDGFVLTSDYLHYRPNDRFIDIPVQYRVHGEGDETSKGSGTDPHTSEQRLSFDSDGFEFQMKKGRILLPRAARVFAESPQREKTVIDSDQCVIQRNEQTAHFTMYPSRPVASRFVQINQPTLFVRARRANLNYGDYSNMLNYMIAYEDVLIKELPKSQGAQLLKYGTGGQASFDTKKNVITLTEFPQVYQDNDTVTGDIIVLHRDTDVVEVEHSNAFSQGQQQ